MKMIDTTPTISDIPTRDPLVQVPPLVSSTKEGKRYERPEHVQEQICTMLALPRSRWVAQAKKLRNETLVFLIRLTHRVDDDLCGALLETLRERIINRARRFCKGLDQVDREEVLLGVEMKVLELVLTKEGSCRHDFLEVAFAAAIKDFTENQRAKVSNSPSGNVVDYVTGPNEDADDEEIERPIEFVPAEAAGPEDTLLNLDSRKHRHRLLRRALNAIADRRFREAFILHFGKDWPITSKRRGADTLQRYFRKDPRQIKYWLDTAMKQVRDALGVKLNGESSRRRFDLTLKRSRLHPSTTVRVHVSKDSSIVAPHLMTMP